jgi:hypothetical protein
VGLMSSLWLHIWQLVGSADGICFHNTLLRVDTTVRFTRCFRDTKAVFVFCNETITFIWNDSQFANCSYNCLNFCRRLPCKQYCYSSTPWQADNTKTVEGDADIIVATSRKKVQISVLPHHGRNADTSVATSRKEV